MKVINVSHTVAIDFFNFHEGYAYNTYSVQSVGTLKFTTATASDDRQGRSKKRKILCVKVFEIKEILIIFVNYGNKFIPKTILVGKSCRKRSFLRDMGTDIKVSCICR